MDVSFCPVNFQEPPSWKVALPEAVWAENGVNAINIVYENKKSQKIKGKDCSRLWIVGLGEGGIKSKPWG